MRTPITRTEKDRDALKVQCHARFRRNGRLMSFTEVVNDLDVTQSIASLRIYARKLSRLNAPCFAANVSFQRFVRWRTNKD